VVGSSKIKKERKKERKKEEEERSGEDSEIFESPL